MIVLPNMIVHISSYPTILIYMWDDCSTHTHEHSNIFLSINSYYIYKNLWLVGGIPTPLKNMKVHGKDYPNGN